MPKLSEDAVIASIAEADSIGLHVDAIPIEADFGDFGAGSGTIIGVASGPFTGLLGPVAGMAYDAVASRSLDSQVEGQVGLQKPEQRLFLYITDAVRRTTGVTVTSPVDRAASEIPGEPKLHVHVEQLTVSITSSAKYKIQLLDVDNRTPIGYVIKTVFCNPRVNEDKNQSDAVNQDIDYLLRVIADDAALFLKTSMQGTP